MTKRKPALDPDALAAAAGLLGSNPSPEVPWPGAIAFDASLDRTRLDAGRLSSAAAASSALRLAIEAAVDRALEGVTRVAVLTGGGLDSSALLATAVRWAERTRSTAFAVTLDFGGPGDDRPYLRAVERHLGVEILRVRPEDAAARMALFHTGVADVPFTWPGGPMEVEVLARARAAGADCALMGVGADQLFDGEPRALAELATSSSVWSAARSARRLEGFKKPRFPVLSWIARPMLASALPLWARRRRARRVPVSVAGWAGPTLLRVAARAHAMEIERALRPCRAPRERFERFVSSPHLNPLALLRHQEVVASGLERRDPFLDALVVGTVARMDPPLLLAGDTRRGLFRRAFADLLPPVVAERQDKAEFEPAFVRFATAIGGLAALRPLADVTELARLGIAVPDAFREAFEAFVAEPDDPDGWSSVWPALAVEAFLRSSRGHA